MRAYPVGDDVEEENVGEPSGLRAVSAATERRVIELATSEEDQPVVDRPDRPICSHLEKSPCLCG